jgi:hypothetical protein
MPIHRNWNPWIRTGFVAIQDPPSSNQNAAICPSPAARASIKDLFIFKINKK